MGENPPTLDAAIALKNLTKANIVSSIRRTERPAPSLLRPIQITRRSRSTCGHSYSHGSLRRMPVLSGYRMIPNGYTPGRAESVYDILARWTVYSYLGSRELKANTL